MTFQSAIIGLGSKIKAQQAHVLMQGVLDWLSFLNVQSKMGSVRIMDSIMVQMRKGSIDELHAAIDVSLSPIEFHSLTFLKPPCMRIVHASRLMSPDHTPGMHCISRHV